jgi:hypothetical protein
MPPDPSVFPDDSTHTHVIEFDEEFTLEFRAPSGDVAMRFIRFRIVSCHDKPLDGQPPCLTSVRFEVQDDADLYSIIEAEFDAQQFGKLKATNQLTVEFRDFPGAVQTLLKDSLKTRSEITVIFWEEGEGSGRLEFTQLLGLKAVEIFKIPFRPSSTEFITGQVQYRYDKLSFESKRKKLMLVKFKQEMRSRNPILYHAIDPRQKMSPCK